MESIYVFIHNKITQLKNGYIRIYIPVLEQIKRVIMYGNL